MEKHHKQISAGAIIAIVFSVLAFLGLVLLFYRKLVKREIKDEMRSQINSAVR